MSEANKINIIAGLFTAYDYESISITNTVTGLTEARYLDSDGFYAKRIVIAVETAQIRYRYDGGNPSASEGMPANPMDIIILKGSSNIKNFKAIRTGSTSAALRIIYEK